MLLGACPVRTVSSSTQNQDRVGKEMCDCLTVSRLWRRPARLPILVGALADSEPGGGLDLADVEDVPTGPELLREFTEYVEGAWHAETLRPSLP